MKRKARRSAFLRCSPYNYAIANNRPIEQIHNDEEMVHWYLNKKAVYLPCSDVTDYTVMVQSPYYISHVVVKIPS